MEVWGGGEGQRSECDGSYYHSSLSSVHSTINHDTSTYVSVCDLPKARKVTCLGLSSSSPSMPVANAHNASRVFPP